MDSRHNFTFILSCVRRLVFRIHYPLFVRRRLERTDRTRIGDIELSVEPGVFHPALFRSSKVLLSSLQCLDLNEKVMLDMGTGSGIIAIGAATLGARAVAVDINPTAVRCAQANAERNGVASRITLIESDLFSRIPAGIRFDVIIWNPPFFDGVPTNAAEHAWLGGQNLQTLRRFVEALPSFLADNGSVVILTSSDMNERAVAGMFRDAKFMEEVVARKWKPFEKLRVLRYNRASS